MTDSKSDPRDYIVELSSVPNPAPAPPPYADAPPSPTAPRVSFLSIHFKCCHVYARIYKNAAGTAYTGHCPRCRRPASIAIGPGGSASRIFQAE